ncbi:cation diffusion facilitator family transporter [Neisseria sp.]|uniref:cation diffusion facilitator family transporter n=1 Tax=Neisseria sp. TaxID=192066 RepID=UPI00289FD81A|nr:cation diffusion facilitator family transporter [Neisseria sp.]
MNSSPYPDFSDTEITPQMQQAAKRSTWVSVVVNTILSALQIAIGFFAQSQALIADGIHSLSDLLSDFVVLIAGRYSEKEADEGHPYGHRRYENAASLVLGVLLLSVAVGMIFRAVEKFAEPDAIAQVHSIALWVALLTLLMKEALFRYMLAAAKRVRSGMLAANAWHARSDAASSLVVAIGIVGNLMGYPLLDPLAALVVGMMVGRMGIRFGWLAFQDLMDASADEETLARIRSVIERQQGVLGYHDLRTRKLGDMVNVDVHIEVDSMLSVVEGHEIAVQVAEQLKKLNEVIGVMVHIDPRARD